MPRSSTITARKDLGGVLQGESRQLQWGIVSILFVLVLLVLLSGLHQFLQLWLWPVWLQTLLDIQYLVGLSAIALLLLLNSAISNKPDPIDSVVKNLGITALIWTVARIALVSIYVLLPGQTYLWRSGNRLLIPVTEGILPMIFNRLEGQNLLIVNLFLIGILLCLYKRTGLYMESKVSRKIVLLCIAAFVCVVLAISFFSFQYSTLLWLVTVFANVGMIALVCVQNNRK